MNTLLVSGLLLAPLSAFAHGHLSYDGPVSESAVLSALHHANRMEIRMGMLAQQNAGSQAIRDYGALLVKDHGAADSKVLRASREDGVKIEDVEMSPEETEAWNHLSTIRGAAFDQAFSETMERDHAEVVKVLDYDLGQLPESRTQSLVSALLPKLREHEERAKRLVARTHPAQQGGER